MNLLVRTTLILTLALAFAAGMNAQESSTATGSATTTTTTSAANTSTSAAQGETEGAAAEAAEPQTAAEAQKRRNSYELRDRFVNLLNNHPPELSTILVLDPSLLSNDGFLTAYPDLAKFVADYPEVRRNPRFYLESFKVPGEGSRILDEMFEVAATSSIFLIIIFAIFWLVRTIVEQKRWSRLSKTQAEVHNKILDRFSTSEELLEYVRSPAGTKFLESAPIPLHAEQAPQNAQVTRIMWSLQLGIVVMAAAIGMLLVSTRFEAEASHGFFALGFIGLCIGAGFIASAVVTLVVSRRLGLGLTAGTPADDTPAVRRSEG